MTDEQLIAAHEAWWNAQDQSKYEIVNEHGAVVGYDTGALTMSAFLAGRASAECQKCANLCPNCNSGQILSDNRECGNCGFVEPI